MQYKGKPNCVPPPSSQTAFAFVERAESAVWLGNPLERKKAKKFWFLFRQGWNGENMATGTIIVIPWWRIISWEWHLGTGKTVTLYADIYDMVYFWRTIYNNFIHSSHRFTYFTMLRSGAETSRSIHGREWDQLNFFGRWRCLLQGRNWQLHAFWDHAFEHPFFTFCAWRGSNPGPATL